jgi:hypothetical protein
MSFQTSHFGLGIKESHEGKTDTQQAQDSTDAKAQVEMMIQKIHSVNGVLKLTPLAIGSRPTTK